MNFRKTHGEETGADGIARRARSGLPIAWGLWFALRMLRGFVGGWPWWNKRFWLVAPIAFAAAGFLLERVPLFEDIEQRTLNARVQFRAKVEKEPHADPRLMLVAIDDGSLEACKNYGRWPWPRSLHAEFIKALAQRPPAVVGWDIIFSESDSEENDNALALAFSEANFHTVIGAAGIPSSESNALGGGATSPPLPNVTGVSDRIPPNASAILPLEAFQFGSHFGFVDVSPDSDGVRRRVPMVVRIRDQFFPTLSLRVLMDYWKLEPEDVMVDLGKSIRIPSQQVEIPIDLNGEMRINYRYEADGFLHVPYSKLLNGLIDLNKTGALPNKMPDPQGKILMVGLTATGITDIGPSPLDPLSPLVLVHLNALNNILRADYLHVVPRPLLWLGWLVVSTLSLLGARRLPPTAASALAILLLLGYVALTFGLFVAFSIQLALAMPVVTFFLLHALEQGRRIMEEQKARRELRSRFSPYLAKAVLEEVLASGRSPSLGGLRKHASIMFTDIRSFTTMAETAEVEALVNQLNEYLTAMVECVNDNRGTLHKFIGDAIMAVWGDTFSDGDRVDALRAVRAALQMRRELARLNERWGAAGQPRWTIGIGINFGAVLVGNIGAPQRMEFTVIGDAVNVASRIEGATKQLGEDILVAGSVAQLTKTEIASQPVGAIRVMGRSGPLAVYRVIGESRDLGDNEREWLEKFEAGFTALLTRDFEAAKAAFAFCLQARPGDIETAARYAEAADFCKTPPGPDWDGSLNLRTK
jgi:adenylate cyclase